MKTMRERQKPVEHVDEHEVGFARDIVSGRHSIIPALIAIGICAVLTAWQVFFAVEDDLDLGDKFAIFGAALFFWALWVVFTDVSLTTARKNLRRHPIAVTLALLIFAYMALPPIADAIVGCIAAGSLMPAYGAINLKLIFAPFVTEVALRIFLAVADVASKNAENRKK